MRKLFFGPWFFFIALVGLWAQEAIAGITFEPFVSMTSSKSIKPDKANKTQENVTQKQRTFYGIRAGLSFFRILRFQLGLSQSKVVATQKTQAAVDDYDQIDYEKDLNMDTSVPDNEIKTTEIQRRGQATLVVDPSFSIFILRAKAGLIATQRLVSLEQGGETTSTTTPITYKPTAGAGAGIKIGTKMYFIAKYNLFLYKFPETAPFEREVLVTYGISI